MKHLTLRLPWKLRRTTTTATAVCCMGILLAGCTTDAYEKGDGTYSGLQAELAEVSITASRSATGFVADNGQHYVFDTPVQVAWAKEVDSTYRAAVYFEDLGNGTAKCLSVGRVPTLRPVAHWKMKETADDPVGYESVWPSESGRYVNLALLLKSGYDDSDKLHAVSLSQDTVICHANGCNTAHYRLFHNQNLIPQYYTDRYYVSILLPDTARLDTVVLQMNTTAGMVRKTIPVK